MRTGRDGAGRGGVGPKGWGWRCVSLATPNNSIDLAIFLNVPRKNELQHPFINRKLLSVVN